MDISERLFMPFDVRQLQSVVFAMVYIEHGYRREGSAEGSEAEDEH